METERRLTGLDAIRAIAAALVLVSHADLSGLIDIPTSDNHLGRVAVLIFFALSGYVIWTPFTRGSVNLRDYARRRFLRIVPAYLFALVGLTILTGNHSFVDHPLTYLTFQQNTDPTLVKQFTGTAWSLCIEVVFYLAVPLLALVFARRPVWLAVLGAVSLVGFAATISAPETFRLLPVFWLWAFVPGMLLAYLPPVPGRLWTMTGTLVLALVVLWPSVALEPVASVAAAILIAGAMTVQAPRLLATSGRTLSYPFYLWSSDLLAFGLLAGTAGGLVAAAASWRLVERPAMRHAPIFFVSVVKTRMKSIASSAPTASVSDK